MIYCQPCQPGPPPTTEPNGGADDYYGVIQLIMMNTSLNRRWYLNHRRILITYVSHDPTGATPRTYYRSPPHILPRAPTNGPSPPPLDWSYSKAQPDLGLT